MNRRTLARHRFTGGHRFARTSAEGGGGGGGGTGGNGGGTNEGGAGDGSGSGGGGSGGGGDPGSSGPTTDPNDPNYFPPNTAVAEMTPDQRAAYWRNQAKVIQQRVPANLTELQQKARDYDELIASTRSEAEVAIDEALDMGREEGRAEVRQEAAAEILRAQLAATGRTDDQVATLMRGLNPAGFLGQDGKIDVPAITAFAATLGGGDAGHPITGGADLGQGRRGGQSKPSVAAGRDLFEQTHAKKTAASSTA